MPFDIFTAAAVRDELALSLDGAQVDKVIQTSDLAVALRVWGRSWRGSIVLSADARHARVYATETKLSKGLETPPPFLMLLRKYCTGGRIIRVDQVHLDRILTFDLAHREHGHVQLVCEVMGNRSNIILVSDEGTILGALKLIGPKQSRTRRIGPHVRYERPGDAARSASFGSGPKLDPLAPSDLTKIRAALGQAPDGMTAVDALVGLLRGCSPAIARDIMARAGGKVSFQEGNDREIVATAIEEQYGLFRSRAWSPILMFRDSTPVDYRAYAEPAIAGAEPAESMSRAVEQVSGELESTDVLLASRKRVRTVIDRRRSEIRGRLASLETGLRASEDADNLLEKGNLVLGFQYQIEPDAPLFEVPESDIRITLDPELSPVENAERYFKRYRKARDAAKRLPTLMRTANSDLEFVDELDTFVELAETPGDLKRIEAEYETRFGGPAKQSAGKTRQPTLGRILTVDLSPGERVLVGRSARQNEEVTFKLAGRSDLWMHARGVPGAHVVLKSVVGDDDDTPSLRMAASLAAYYSKARSEPAADVIVARVRDVHRVPGGAIGQVTVRNGRTIRAKPVSAEEMEAEEG